MILGIIVSPLSTTCERLPGPRQKPQLQNATLLPESHRDRDAYGIDQIVQYIYLTGSSSLGGLAGDVGLYTESGGDYTRLDPDEIGELAEREQTYILGVKNMRLSETGAVCDAVVTLSASEFAQNESPVSNYTTMDCVYLQPKEMDDNQDYTAAVLFADEAMLLQREDPSCPTGHRILFLPQGTGDHASTSKRCRIPGARAGLSSPRFEITYTGESEGNGATDTSLQRFARIPYDEEAEDLASNSRTTSTIRTTATAPTQSPSTITESAD